MYSKQTEKGQCALIIGDKQQIDDEVFGKDRLSTNIAPIVQNCCEIVGEKNCYLNFPNERELLN